MQLSTIRKGTRACYREIQHICGDSCLQPSASYLCQAWCAASAVRGVSVPHLRREKQNCGLPEEVTTQLGTSFLICLQFRCKNITYTCDSAISRSLLLLNISQTVTGFKHCPAHANPSMPWRADKEEERPMLWTVSLLRAHADIYPGSGMSTTLTALRKLMLLRAFCTASGLQHLRWRKHAIKEPYATLLTQAWGVNIPEGGSTRAKSTSSDQANRVSNLRSPTYTLAANKKWGNRQHD